MTLTSCLSQNICTVNIDHGGKESGASAVLVELLRATSLALPQQPPRTESNAGFTGKAESFGTVSRPAVPDAFTAPL